jgi:hypothetical protein
VIDDFGEVALVLGQRAEGFGDRTRLFVLFVLPTRERHDLRIEAAGGLRGGGALLALQGVLVLLFSRHVVTFRDDVGRLNHRHEEVGFVPQQPFFREELDVQVVLHEADRFAAARDHGGGAVDHHALRRNADRLQARGAVPIDRRAGDFHRQARANRGVARQVVAGRAFGQAAADDDVFDIFRPNAGALDGMRDGVAGEGRAVGLIERPAERAADRRARARDDDCFFHFTASKEGRGANEPPLSASCFKSGAGCQCGPTVRWYSRIES